MARKTVHESCIRCSSRAQVCAYTGFYVLTSKPQKATKNRTRQKQVRGVLPARGFCIDCFLRYAERQGWDGEVMHKVRSTLGITRKVR